MLAKVFSGATMGLDSVSVEVDKSLPIRVYIVKEKMLEISSQNSKIWKKLEREYQRLFL